MAENDKPIEEKRLPRLVYNRLTIIGAYLAVSALGIFLFLLLITALTDRPSPYAGIVTYMIIPVFILFGLALMPLGVFRQWRRRRRGDEVAVPVFPVIDFNDARQRNLVLLLIGCSGIFVLFTAFGSYKAFHFTESVDFCGRTCHEVMHPEYESYNQSPHARVTCVECHVGEGADWYAKSKMSGLYQVYATLFNKYPKPISTPIKNLRPAQETCEHCHWPGQFFGAQQKMTVHFLPDSANTQWNVNLLIQTGGGHPMAGQGTGIHWHMNILNKVEYIATDEKRFSIPWIKTTDLRTNESVVYQSTVEPLAEDELEKHQTRGMDCMDCHNRPTHVIRSPNEAIDMALATGVIDKSLPFLKKVGVEALAGEYETEEEAREGIANHILGFYRNEFPDLFVSERETIEEAVLGLQKAYERNFFPRMKADWRVYHDNIGHLEYPGCYRCHDGNHESPDGRVLSNDCNVCHIILSQGPGDPAGQALSASGQDFQHPSDIDEAWRVMSCSDCHEGLLP
ncbi:cytochrome c3 family protein [candidate division KSB1 bacterium]